MKLYEHTEDRFKKINPFKKYASFEFIDIKLEEIHFCIENAHTSN